MPEIPGIFLAFKNSSSVIWLRQLLALRASSKTTTPLQVEDSSNHKLLGYVHAEVYESLYSQPGFNILALAVQPDHQGQGIGKSLLEGLEKEAKRRGYGFIRLNSADHRLAAHAFYEKVGYTCDKMQKRFIRIF